MTIARRGLVAVAAIGLVAGCSLQTAGAPRGDTTLYVMFDDVQHLVTGHAVKVADVQVGSIVEVKLVGYRARVALSIVNSREIPVGTTAVLGQTSLLGENYIQLRFPEDFDPDEGPFLEDGDEIPDAQVDPQLEDVTERAINLLAAVQAGDVATILDAAATGFGGRGEQLDQLVDQLARVGATFGDQRDDIATAVDGLGQLGRDLAARSDDVGVFIDDLARATAVLAEQRTRIVDTVASLTDLARTLNDEVLEPHRGRLDTILKQLDPIVATIAGERDTLLSLTSNLETLAIRAPHSVDDNSAILLYAWVSGLILPNGDEIPFPTSGQAAVTELLDPGP